MPNEDGPKTTIPVDVMSAGLDVVTSYARMIRKGQSPVMAEMLALRSAPRAMTDREFLSGQGTLAKQFEGDDRGLELVVGNAMKRGYRPSPNDVYIATLANDTGDPLAFVKGRGDVKAVCEERGMDCDGAVKVRAYRSPERDPAESRPQLADDLAEAAVNKQIHQNPDVLRQATRRELKEDVIFKNKVKLTED